MVSVEGGLAAVGSAQLQKVGQHTQQQVTLWRFHAQLPLWLFSASACGTCVSWPSLSSLLKGSSWPSVVTSLLIPTLRR